MSTENTPNATPVVTTGHEEQASSISLHGQDFKPNDVAEQSIAVDPTEAEVDADLRVQEAEEGDDLEGEGAEPSEKETSKDTADEGTEGEAGEALPDYAADDEAVIAKYDAKYLKTDEGGRQVINVDAFTEELNANYAEGKLDINPGSRQYVKDTFAVDDATIDTYLQGLKTTADAKDNAIYSQVGGKEAWESLVDWGKENYTEAQQKRFNEALTKGGDEAAEQIELLKARASGKAKVGTSPGRIGRRPSSPQKSAGGSSATREQVQGFGSQEEHRVAMVAAEASGDTKKIEEVRKRLRASSWFSANG